MQVLPAGGRFQVGVPPNGAHGGLGLEEPVTF
jgi:hypothetical protein